MDWTPYVSAFLVLAGTLLGIVGSVVVQMIVQRNENKRALRRLAYEAAIIEWRTFFEQGFREKNGKPFELAAILTNQISVAAMLHKFSPSSRRDTQKLNELLECEFSADVPVGIKGNKKSRSGTDDNHAAKREE